MESTKDNHSLHLKCDVLLLADVFKKIRNRCLENYGLRPSYQLSAPVLSQDVTLLKSNFIENTLRHWCSPVDLQHIFRTPFLKNTSGRLLLQIIQHYPLAPDKLEIKREMLSIKFYLKIADNQNISIGNVKKLVPNFPDKGRYVLHYKSLPFYFRLGLKKLQCVLEFHQSKLRKPYIEFYTHKRIESEKMATKREKHSIN